MDIKLLAKTALRISDNNTAFDSEIENLIEAAKLDMEHAGIDPAVISIGDDLIDRAIILYCKAYFGWDNPDQEKLVDSYTAHVNKIRLTPEYKTPRA